MSANSVRGGESGGVPLISIQNGGGDGGGVPLVLVAVSGSAPNPLISVKSCGCDQPLNAEARDGRSRIAAQTVYMYEAIEGFHRITITGELNGNGKLILNPNSCRVNQFGDAADCQEAAETIVSISIQDTNVIDPNDLGRKLYSLIGAGLRNPLFLVVCPTSDRPIRMVYNDRSDKAPVSITLEPLVYSDRGTKSLTADARDEAKWELCNGKYSAQQFPGTVLITASGVHEQSGYKTSLVELPLDIFPPQFQLMHVKPKISSTVITPFSVTQQFKALDIIQEIIVFDKAGRHVVPVEQVPEVG